MQLELEYILYKDLVTNYVLTEDDIQEVKTFLLKKQEESQRWSDLVCKISRLHRIEDYTQHWGGGQLRTGIGLPLVMVADGKNTNERLYSSDEAEIIIIFAAVCPEDSPYYWEAKLTIPPETTPETTLSLFIKDGKETPIQSGKFVLFDLELSIEDGIAEISFDQFLTDLKKHFVKLVFPDETESKGTLRYF